MNDANSHQIAGEHYKSKLQHWDFAYVLYGPGYFYGQITKYVYRWRLKNGIEDLKKALHFLQKLMELETAAAPRDTIVAHEQIRYVGDFATVNNLGDAEYSIILLTTLGDLGALHKAEEVLLALIDSAEEGAAPTKGYIDQG